MSLRAMRRSLVAVTAVGGTLALAASASAIPVPIGNSTDAPYSGSGTPSTIFSLFNAANNGLVQAQNLIVGANGVAGVNHTPAVDSSTAMQTNFTSASQISSSTIVTEIATDISTPANAFDLEVALCVANAEAGGASQGAAFAACDTPPTAPAAAVTAFTGTIQPEVASAAGNWPNLSDLTGFLAPAAGVLDSADGASVSSTGTVTSTKGPAAYDVKLSAPSGGYIVPGAFSMTFPAALGVNAALVGAEVNAATNTAAVELNPTGTSIGTVTLTSPLADEFGGSNNQLVGKIYVVQTGQSSGQGSFYQPYLELWFPGVPGFPIYALGSFPSLLSFPLKLTFGEAYVSLLRKQEPLPLNSLELNFPAATSPVTSKSCTTMGTAGGEVMDSIANLAYEFGDATDGVTSLSGTPTAVALAATPTAVTDKCATNSASGIASGLTSSHPTVTLNVKAVTAFKTVAVGLPGGLKLVKSKTLAKEVSAAKVKSVKIAGGKLVITLKSSLKSLTIKTKKGLISESSALMKSIKKHKTKTLTFTVHAGSASLKVKVKA